MIVALIVVCICNVAAWVTVAWALLADRCIERSRKEIVAAPWNWNTTTRDPVGWVNAHQPLDRKDQK